jgi:hypothetical protein
VKTRDLRQNTGAVTGFIVSNTFLSRYKVPKIVAAIPGARVIRKQKHWAFSAPDDFCEFVVDGKSFLAIEPFGDNDCYWVVSEPPEDCPQLSKVRAAFEHHRVLFGAYAG